jgi:hypothetical protein
MLNGQGLGKTVGTVGGGDVDNVWAGGSRGDMFALGKYLMIAAGGWGGWSVKGVDCLRRMAPNWLYTTEVPLTPEEAMSHPWFSGVDWDEVAEGVAVAPASLLEELYTF